MCFYEVPVEAFVSGKFMRHVLLIYETVVKEVHEAA